MNTRQTAPYGSWESPITSDMIAEQTVRFEQVTAVGKTLYWLEERPKENGRSVIMRCDQDDNVTELTPDPFNVRSRVHEYGGGAYAVAENEVFFVNYQDQDIYRQDSDGPPRAVTAAPNLRFAALTIDRYRNRIICIREDHTTPDGTPENAVAAVGLPQDKSGGITLLSGNDFYAAPRISRDGTQLSWLTWSQPDMPWDGTELWVGEFDSDGTVSKPRCIAGGPGESIFQPEWGPDGRLYFCSDRTGWWNIYRWDGEDTEALTDLQAEFGLPQWKFGLSTYAFYGSQTIFCVFTSGGTWSLAKLDTANSLLNVVETPYTELSSVSSGDRMIGFQAGSPSEPPQIVKYRPGTGELEVVRRSSQLDFSRGFLAIPEAIEYPTSTGETAHAIFYRPHNEDYVGPEDEQPPVLVVTHGGPTGRTSTALKLAIQFWTSRGFAVLDVNYRGSTGYGRQYRESLYGRWGVAEVDDCIHGVRYLAREGYINRDKALIRGGSAGGYTTLAALTFHETFAAGASYYGVSDLEALAQETHKFESRYLDRLIGPYPEEQNLYRERSPLNHIEQLDCPIIFFQGLKDRVVPPNQAELMVERLRTRGIPVAYVSFEEERHGFRRAENTRKALDAELYFFSRVLGFEPADELQEIGIYNL